MELRQLKYFLKAKELLNFTKAATSLHISQSTLSQQIKQLEEELDVPLFNRVGKRIIISEAGELFADYASRSVKYANDGFLLLNDLNNLNTGEIAIGVTYGLRNLLIQALIKFTKQLPKISVQIVFGTSEEIIEKLNRFELDFVLAFQETTEEKHFKYQKLFSSTMTLFVSKKSHLSTKSSITLEEISEIPLALPDKGYNTRRYMSEVFKKKNINPKVLIEINDIPTLLELVRTGNWSTILAQTSVTEKDNLFTIPIKEKNITRTAMIVSLKEAYEKKTVRIFYELLTKLISANNV